MKVKFDSITFITLLQILNIEILTFITRQSKLIKIDDHSILNIDLQEKLF